MSDDLRDIDIIDVTALFDVDLAALGDSVLDHALRRRLGDGTELASNTTDPIAAHDSHV